MSRFLCDAQNIVINNCDASSSASYIISQGRAISRDYEQLWKIPFRDPVRLVYVMPAAHYI